MMTQTTKAVPTSKKRKVGLSLMLALATATATGCSSMVNPYLDFGDAPKPSVTTGSGNTKSTTERQIPLHEAIEYAETVKQEYRGAIGDEATFTKLVGAGVIGTATAIPIMALTDAGTKALGLVGVSGAGAFALATWLQSEPRQRAYIRGYKAVNCAIGVVSPLAFERSQEPYKSFNDAVDGIASKIADLDREIAATKLDLAAVTSRNVRAQVTQLITTAETAQSEAKAARRKGLEVRLRIAAAGGRLTTAVDRIIGEVDSAVQANEPNFASLSGIIGGLGGIYGQFPGAPTVSVFGSTAAGQGLQVGGSAKRMADATAEVAANTLAIADFVAALATAQPKETLETCQVDPATITVALSVSPDSATFSGTRDETKPFQIQGGTFPYMVSLDGTASNLVSVHQPAAFGPTFTITVKKDAPAGLYAIHIADGSRRNASLAVTIGASDPGAGNGGATPAVAVAGGEYFNSLNESDRKKIQRALCVKDDGVWGKDTRDALRDRAKTDVSSKENMDAQLALTDAQVTARCTASPRPDTALTEAAKKLNSATVTLSDPKGFVVAVKEVKVVTAEGKTALDLTLKLFPAEGSSPAKASAIRAALLTEIIKNPNVTVDQLRIANQIALTDAKLLVAE